MYGIMIAPEEMLERISGHEVDDSQPPAPLLGYQTPRDGSLSIPEGVSILQIRISRDETLS
jgi:hypothetical protein